MQVESFLLILFFLGLSLAFNKRSSEEYVDTNDEEVVDSEEKIFKKLSNKYTKVKPPKPTVGLLYPRESETREVRSLDGMWRLIKCNASNPLQGVQEAWFQNSLRTTGHKVIAMPVPASYNDITTDNQLRDHVGIVWYERNFFAPSSWRTNRRIWLRFGSVHYAATVWLNGKHIAYHQIGHLPFEAEVTTYLKFGHENRLTVMCDNRLGKDTMPPGVIGNFTSNDGSEPIQVYTFDFFNYAGIQRSVHLYTTPIIHIKDIDIKTHLTDKNNVGQIEYCLLIVDKMDNGIMPFTIKAKLRDRDGTMVLHSKSENFKCPSGFFGSVLLMSNVKPWWPYLMHPEPGYLYNLEFQIFDVNLRILDSYRMPVGIRTLRWNSNSLLINGKSIYFRGFGKHEDSDIRGKGWDNAIMSRDLNLLKWIGANAYRTSHYPYSEESMQFADEQGIMIIDECSAVNIERFEPETLINHMSALEQLIHRDRNHASVIAWSIANEARSFLPGAWSYFKSLVDYIRRIAKDRPLTGATNAETYDGTTCKMSMWLDIIGFNRYLGWYRFPGRTKMIVQLLYTEAKRWHDLYKKPVLIFEYGADTMEGLHLLPASMWSEEYQVNLFSEYFKTFDKLRKHKWFIGEFVWNFADFQTAQAFRRVGGNRKGVFTRNRQPKMVAYLLRERYFALGKKLDNCSLPNDLFIYIADTISNSRYGHSEL